MVVPECIGILRLAADMVLDCTAAGRASSRPAPPHQLWATGLTRRADRIGRGKQSISLPSTFLLQVAEVVADGATTRSTDIDLDRRARGPTAVVPLLHNGVIRSWTESEKSVDLCAANLVRELSRCRIDPHGGDAFRALRAAGCNILNGTGDVAVIGWCLDGNPSVSE